MKKTEERIKLNKMLGEKIKHCRTSIALTQSELAEFLNVSRSLYAYYETGSVTPSLQFIIDFCKYFNIPLNELIDISYTVESFIDKYTIEYFALNFEEKAIEEIINQLILVRRKKSEVVLSDLIKCRKLLSENQKK